MLYVVCITKHKLLLMIGGHWMPPPDVDKVLPVMIHDFNYFQS